jgi:peptidoglycan/LPS O-acetylase OafA/YrhL
MEARTSAGQLRNAALDGLRGLLSLVVFSMHATFVIRAAGRPIQSFTIAGRTESMLPIGLGWLAVGIFFVLSGFVITRLLLAARGRSNYYADFYLGRVLRILPAYVFLLVVYFGLTGWLHPLFPRVPNDFRVSLLPYLLLYQNFTPSLTYGLGVTWSIAVEMHYYLLIPVLVATVSTRTLQRVFVAVVVATFGAKVIWMQKVGVFPALYTLTAFRFDAFAMGGLLAIWAARTDLAPRLQPALAVLAAVVLPAGLVLTWRWVPLIVAAPKDHAWLAPLAFLLVEGGSLGLIGHCFLRPHAWPSRLLGGLVGRFLGRISYSVYIFHLPLIIILYPWMPFGGAFWPTWLALTACVIAVSTITWATIEFPFYQVLRQRLRARFRVLQPDA